MEALSLGKLFKMVTGKLISMPFWAGFKANSSALAPIAAAAKTVATIIFLNILEFRKKQLRPRHTITASILIARPLLINGMRDLLKR